MSIKKVSIFAIMLFTTSIYAANEATDIFKKCAICHGVNGQKQSLGVSKVIAGWSAKKTIKALKGYKAKEINTYGFGKMMQGQATKLDDLQIKKVAKYIESLKPATANKEKEFIRPSENKKYNNFLKYYFAKNRYATTKEANTAWKKHLLENAK